MAMTAGTVTVSQAGVVTKTGMAGAIFDARVASAATEYAAAGVPFPPSDPVQLVKVYKGLAADSTAIAAGVVGYIVANAKAQILTGDSGLQRTPNPNNAATATDGPAATKYLAIV